MEKPAVVIFAHGSTVEEANNSVYAVAREMAREGGLDRVAVAFLDCVRPTLADAVAELAAAGEREFVVVPYFLTLGTHLERDLPLLVESIRGEHPGIRIDVAAPLAGHPALARILVERAQEALEGRDESSSARVA